MSEDLSADLQSDGCELCTVHGLSHQLEPRPGHPIPTGHQQRSMYRLHHDLYEALHDLHVQDATSALYDLPTGLPAGELQGSRDDFGQRLQQLQYRL